VASIVEIIHGKPEKRLMLQQREIPQLKALIESRWVRKRLKELDDYNIMRGV
jgi:hypothetical protein